IGLGILYFAITVPYRHRFTDADKPSINQQLSFYSGLVLLYIVKGSPVDLLYHIILLAHMIQMALFYFLFLIAIFKGIPNWFFNMLSLHIIQIELYFFLFPIATIREIANWIWKNVINLPVFKHVFKFLTHPLISLLLFSVLLAIYHVPANFYYSKSSKIAHAE